MFQLSKCLWYILFKWLSTLIFGAMKNLFPIDLNIALQAGYPTPALKVTNAIHPHLAKTVWNWYIQKIFPAWQIWGILLFSIWVRARQNQQNYLCAQHAQADQMRRLIWVFAGCTGHFVGFVVLQSISNFEVNLRQNSVIIKGFSRKLVNWASSQENLSLGLLLYYPGSEQQKRWSDCADVQADLHLCFSYMA